MGGSDLPPEVGALRRRFVAMFIVEAVLVLLAVAFALAYYRFHRPWALPAIFVVVAVGLAVQVWTVWSVRNKPSAPTPEP